MRVTLEPSVFVSAYLASDVHHAISMKLLGTLIENKIDPNAPVLVLAEVAAALARNTRDTERGLAAKEMIEQTPRLQLYRLSLPLGKKAADSRARAFCTVPIPSMSSWPMRQGAFLSRWITR